MRDLDEIIARFAPHEQRVLNAVTELVYDTPGLSTEVVHGWHRLVNEVDRMHTQHKLMRTAFVNNTEFRTIDGDTDWHSAAIQLLKDLLGARDEHTGSPSPGEGPGGEEPADEVSTPDGGDPPAPLQR